MVDANVAAAAHCSVPTCHQLDFLPFRCDACGEVFCKDHFAHARHQCRRANSASVQVLLCPICTSSIRMSPDEDPNITWERHFNTSCSQVPQQKKGPATCPVPGCKEKMGLSNRFDCQGCGQRVCMRHRMQEDHPCESWRAEAAASSASRRPARPSAPRAPGAPRPTDMQQGRRQPQQHQQMSDDERLAWELQQQEVAAAQGGGRGGGRGGMDPRGGLAPPPPRQQNAADGKRKKKMSERVLSMFGCFKAPNSPRPRDGLLN